tara:strand:- start:76 stop:282 length:207 start_codon:yes stop_codon:yes gene_type:complete
VQQQEIANMFVERYLTFIEAGYDYYNVSVGSELNDLSLTERSARRTNVLITWIGYENDFYQYKAELMT